MQIIQGKWLQARAQEQWTRSLPLVAERGAIFDTTGDALAISYTTYNVYTRAREIENAVVVAQDLSRLLNLDYITVHQKVTYSAVSEVTIAQQIDAHTAEHIIDLGHKGVYLAKNTKRYYPYGDLLTQVLGFTTVDNIGQAGIEQFYDNYLKGINGSSLIQSDLTGVELKNTLQSYIPPVPGMSIALTIDSKIQLVVEKTLEKLMVEQKAKSATAIVMNPNNGEILSMSTKPSFDLNNVPRDNVNFLLETMKNKSVVDVYEPGSTFKILTMASALQQKVVSTNNRFYCGGSITVDGQRIKCWKSSGHGSQSLIDGFCNSCNVVFVQLALMLGKETFYNRLKTYGLGTPTGVEISGESGGIVMDINTAKRVDLARMGFGQAVAVTPLQLITAICGVLNGGTMFQPSLVKKITAPDGKVVFENTVTPVNTVVNKDVSQLMNIMMEETVSKPGKYTFIPGYEMGGKTGTTQKYENGKISGKYISSFLGAYPASKPGYVVLVIVEQPGTGQYYGSIVASPYAKEIFQGIFEYKNIAPTHLNQANQILSQQITMPSLVGKSLTEAVSILIKHGLSYEIAGDGGIITKQLPPAGTLINKATSVVICAE